MKNYDPIHIKEKSGLVKDYWSPKIIAQLNNYDLKLAKIKGEFIWHKHDETDEAFLVVKGNMVIKFRDGTVNLSEGELYIVPKGVEHKPIADKECTILLIEPMGTVNTGDQSDNKTITNPEWI